MTGKTYYFKLLIYSGILIVSSLLIQSLAPEGFYYNGTIALILFFTALTIIVHRGLMKAEIRGPKHFVRYYIGSTGVRMFMCLIIMVLFGVLSPDNAAAFILTFFILYVFYQAFEVVVLFRQLSTGLAGSNQQNNE